MNSLPTAAPAVDLAGRVPARAQLVHGRGPALAGWLVRGTASHPAYPRPPASPSPRGSAPGPEGVPAHRANRDVLRSPEPAGDIRPRRRADAEPIFVVHKHLSRSEHYDFRLEVDG